MSEIPWRNFESNEDIPKLKQATPEEVNKVKEDVEYSNKLIKINNVLNILDFPDNIEDKFRKVLEKQDDNTLIELATKQKPEILSFLKNQKLNENTLNKKETTIENQKNELKISKLQSIFTPELLDQHPKIKEQFNKLDNATDKEKVFREIINLLKEPWTLQSIIKEIWWADINNPEYIEFKNTLITIDSSFESYFNDLESISAWTSLDTNKIIESIEKDSGWIVDIDLTANTPVSKMSLLWSSYGFEKKIDIKAMSEINSECTKEINSLQNSLAILKDTYVPFGDLLSQIRQNWNKEDFNEKLQNSISSFPSETFTNLNEIYETHDIDSNIHITQNDITDLANIDNPNELWAKINTIKEKFHKIQEHLKNESKEIVQKYNWEFTELLKRDSEQKEKELEVLKFLKKSWFDLIPKEITDQIIKELQSNTLTIPWLELNVNNIELENGHFGESWAFIDRDAGINIEAKINLTKFVNKLISWNIWEPLNADAIANWVSVADPRELKGKFEQLWLVDNLWWKYTKIIENLKKNPTHK